jgi:type IV pilus assembly protein PilV
MRYPSVRGFSLVEVMVAVVVICVGLLGIAKMQSLALSNMTTSRLRSLAAFEAASLAAAMHSNRDYWSTQVGNFPAYNITVNKTANPVIQSSDGALQGQANTDLATPGACVNPGGGGPACPNATQLAAYDLALWWTDLTLLLPNPQAIINCPSVAGVTAPTACTIKLMWSETAVAINTQEATQQAAGANANQGFDTPTYILYVEP